MRDALPVVVGHVSQMSSTFRWAMKAMTNQGNLRDFSMVLSNCKKYINIYIQQLQKTWNKLLEINCVQVWDTYWSYSTDRNLGAGGGGHDVAGRCQGISTSWNWKKL